MQQAPSLNTSSINTSSLDSQSNTPKTIIFLARQHSGESISSFFIEGIIEFLMDNTQVDIFKKNFHFIVIPFVNPDGVKYGNQMANLAGVDLEKSWKKPNQLFEPEIYHIKNLLNVINQVNPISLIMDLETNSQRYLFCQFSLSSYFTTNMPKRSNQ